MRVILILIEFWMTHDCVNIKLLIADDVLGHMLSAQWSIDAFPSTAKRFGQCPKKREPKIRAPAARASENDNRFDFASGNAGSREAGATADAACALGLGSIQSVVHGLFHFLQVQNASHFNSP